MMQRARATRFPIRTLRLRFGVAALAALASACGPAAIGAALSGGGGGGGGPQVSTVNFVEVEPNNDGMFPNIVGPMFPGRTYVISGSHPVGADLDFFGVTANQPTRMQIRLIPAGNADMVLLVGPQIDNGAGGATESFVVDLNPGIGFSSGSREFNNAATAYTMRLIGQSPPGLTGGDDPPTETLQHTTYIQLDEQGRVISRRDVRQTEDHSEAPSDRAEAAEEASAGRLSELGAD